MAAIKSLKEYGLPVLARKRINGFSIYDAEARDQPAVFSITMQLPPLSLVCARQTRYKIIKHT